MLKVKCKFCDKEFSNYSRLQIHLSKIHNIDCEQYFLENISGNDNIPSCPICGSNRKFASLSIGFFDTCGKKSCQSTLANIRGKEKHRSACKIRNEKWKSEILPSGLTKQQEIINKGQEKRNQKSIQTGKKISKSLKKKDKNGLTEYQKTCLEKFGVSNVMKIPMIVDRLSKTFRENYGCEWITQNHNIKQKIQSTMVDRYGESNYTKTNSYKIKQKQYHYSIMIERIKKYFLENNLEFIDDISNYQNEKTIINYRCKKCKTEYRKCWNDIQQFWVCRVCNPNFSISSYEIELANFFAENNIQFQKRASIIKNPSTSRTWQLDFFLPKFNIAIEFDGLYWHSNKHLLNDYYHIQKMNQCAKQNIFLIHIFEDEWVLHKSIVLSRLSYLLNLQKNTIYARKCEVRQIDAKIKNSFLDSNHLQGKDSSSIKLGLFYNDELVSVMTFSNLSISKGSSSLADVWELNRFCSKINYRVIGSASKLLSYFEKNYRWKQIISYCDRRWSNGKIYKKLGFHLVSQTEPNYWYINFSKSIKRYHRFNFRKSNLKNMTSYDDSLTEKEIMTLEGYSWIYDCGNLKFVLENK